MGMKPHEEQRTGSYISSYMQTMTGKHQMKGTRVGRECKNDLDTTTALALESTMKLSSISHVNWKRFNIS